MSPAHPSQSSVLVCFQPSSICFIWTQILSLFAENRVHIDAFAQPCYHRVHCLVHATVLLDGVCWHSLAGSQVVFSCSVTTEKNYCNVLYLHCVLLTLERKYWTVWCENSKLLVTFKIWISWIFLISTMYIQILLSLNSLGLTALVMHGGGIPRAANSFAVFMAIFTVFILSWLEQRLLLVHLRVAFGRSPPSKRDIVGAECNLSHDTALFVYQLSHNSAACFIRNTSFEEVSSSSLG